MVATTAAQMRHLCGYVALEQARGRSAPARRLEQTTPVRLSKRPAAGPPESRRALRSSRLWVISMRKLQPSLTRSGPAQDKSVLERRAIDDN